MVIPRQQDFAWQRSKRMWCTSEVVSVPIFSAESLVSMTQSVTVIFAEGP